MRPIINISSCSSNNNCSISTSISFYSTILLLLLLLQCPTTIYCERRTDLTGIWNELVRTSTATLNQECPTCMSLIHNMVAENVTRTFRVESIKKAILDALGMSEPPKINISLLPIPLPIRNGDVLRKTSNLESDEELMATSANPSKVMVVSSDTSSRQTQHGFQIKFKIEIPWNVSPAELTEATLWLFTKKETNLNRCKFYAKSCGTGNGDDEDFKFITTDSNDFKDEWNLLDLTSTIINWLEYGELCQEIMLNCTDQINDIYNAASTNQSANKPFISVNLSPFSTLNRNRNKRNLNCVASSTDCCREQLSISFSQIKWDWIIQPTSFEAYYCKGKCEHIAALSLGNTPYYSVLQNLRMNMAVGDKSPELRTCCAPTRLTSLQIIYVNQNGTYLEATIPNMSVSSCGCT